MWRIDTVDQGAAGKWRTCLEEKNRLRARELATRWEDDNLLVSVGMPKEGCREQLRSGLCPAGLCPSITVRHPHDQLFGQDEHSIGHVDEYAPRCMTALAYLMP
jgi:hypothetical protein